MSRTVKNIKHELFKKLPQKRTPIGSYDEVEDDLSTEKCLTNTKSSSRSSQETSQGSETLSPQIRLKSSIIHQGVSIKVMELFEEMKSREEALASHFRVSRSSSRALSPRSKSKNSEKIFSRVSSQTNIKGVKATRELPPTSKEGARKLRWLVSINRSTIEPQKVLKRFFTLTELDSQVYIIALICLHRALDWEPELEVKHFQKLLAGCLLLTSKYLVEGHYWDFEDFGLLSGVSARQLEKIEMCVFRRVLHYTLYISDEEYEGAVRSIMMAQVF